MKRICLFVCSIIVSGIVIILMLNVFIPKIKWNKFEKDVAKFYNGESKLKNEVFTDYSYQWLDYAYKEAPREYEINDMIIDFINCVNKSIQFKIDKKKITFSPYFKSANIDVVGVKGIRDDYIKYIAQLLTEEDIEDYTNNIFIQKLIKELEKKFIHKSSKEYEDWYIANDKDKRIELPYNIYYDFKHNGKILKNKIQHINSIKISQKQPYMCSIEYTDVTGNIEKEEILMITTSYKNSDKIDYALPSLGELFYTNGTNPTLTAGQHDYDEEQKERSRQDEERARLQMEDEANEVVKEEWIGIPQFDNYTKDANLCLRKHITGRYSVQLVLLKRILENDKPKKITRNYTIFYDDVTTKEEALERYLSDKEHFDADEAWLKEWNIDYKSE